MALLAYVFYKGSNSFNAIVIVLQNLVLIIATIRYYKCRFYFKKWAIPGLFFVYFKSLQTNINTILQQKYVKICPSSIRHWDSNPRPSECESPPITTRPGHLPTNRDSYLMSLVAITIDEFGHHVCEIATI